MQPDPPNAEAALLLACARQQLHRRDDRQILQSLCQSIDWRRLVALAGQHHLIPLVHAALSAAPIQAVPPPLRAQLHAAYQANARRMLFLAGQLRQILQWLQEQNLPAIAFKGPLLAAEAYGDLALRSSGDLDLLLHRRDLPAVRRWLIARGFTPIFPTATPRQADYLRQLRGRDEEKYVLSHAEHHLLSPDGRINLDLHWDIALNDFALPMNGPRLWSCARTVAFAGGQVSSLAWPDLLLTLCVNGAKDDWTHFDRLCDVAALLLGRPQLDWPQFLCQARAAGATRMVLLMFCLCRDLLDAPVAPCVARQIAADPLLPRLTAAIRSRLFLPAPHQADDGPSLQHVLLQLGFRNRWRDKLRYLAAQFSPTVGDWSALPLPAGLHFLHYPLRPLRLLLRGDDIR